MRKLILMVGLIVVGIACGDAVNEMLDSGVPDAGAQPGELIVSCDVELYYRDGQDRQVSRLYAEVAAAEMTVPFNAYVCNDGEGIPTSPQPLCSDPSCSEVEPQPRCLPAAVEIRPDGRFRFVCSGSSPFGNPHTGVPDGSYIKIVR